jgi:hypothetical protein
MSIIFQGPLTGSVEIATAANMSTPILIPLDDIAEEGIVMPTEEEATQNNVRGESDQVSVRLTFSMPVFVQAASGALATLRGYATARTRIWVRLTDANGHKVTIGGTVGTRVRKVANQNGVFGSYGTEMFMFEATFARSGQGYTLTAAT